MQADIDRHDDQGWGQFSRAVAHLAHVPKEDWKKPQARKIQGYEDLYEIRYSDHRKETRALGFFGPTEDTFTITLICSKKGDVYKPHNAFQTAVDRRVAIKAGRASSAPLQIDGEDFPPDEGQT